MYRYRAFLPDSVQSFLPNVRNTTAYTRLSTFAEQVNAGLTSENFDIEANNLLAGDTRAGLDEQGTREIAEIMKRERVGWVSSSDLVTQVEFLTNAIGSTKLG